MDFSDYLLGEHIKNARIKKELTQEALAELLDITPTHVKHIESGHRKPSIDILFKTAKILDMSVDNVIFRDNENNLIKTEINEINYLLTKCEKREITVVKDMLFSLIKNR